MIPRCIIFDLGKVLVDFDYGIAIRKIAERAHVSVAEIEQAIHQSPLLFRYEIGEINREQFYHEVCEATGFCGSLEEFGDFFADIFTPIKPMIELHAQLRARQLPTFILSNTNDLAIAHIRRNFPFFANFTGYIFSYEHGAMKPDARLYQTVEQIAGTSGDGLLFLDDLSENIAAAQARGWQVIHHQTPEQTIGAVRDLLKIGN